MSPSEISKCEICRKAAHKYKCPACLAKYCSVPCFKEHKAAKCVVAGKPVIRANEETINYRDDGDASEPYSAFTEDTVPKELLAKLGQNRKLLDILHNPHLQQILRGVDISETPEKSIATAMMEPIFTEFADACLQVIEPEKYGTES